MKYADPKKEFNSNLNSLKYVAPKKILVLILFGSLLLINIENFLKFENSQIISGLSLMTILFVLQAVINFHEKLFITMVGISFLTVSFLFKLDNSTRWIFLVVILVLAIFLSRKSFAYDLRKSSIVSTCNIYLVLLTTFEAMKKLEIYILQFMSYGYDYALHFSLFKAYRNSSWYSFVDPTNWSSSFDTFQKYAGGQAAITSFASEILVNDQDAVAIHLASYLFLLLIVFALTIYLVYRMIVNDSPKINRQVKFISVLGSFSISIAFAGVYITNGFPPYLFAILIILIWINIVQEVKYAKNNIFISIATVLVLIFTCPLSILCIVLPAALLAFNEMQALYRNRNYFGLFLRFIITLTAIYFVYRINSVTNERFGWRQLLASGGIQTPNFLAVSSIILIFFILTIKNWKNLILNSVYLLAASSFLSFAIIAGITIKFTGSIQYYAYKQFYFCIVFISVMLIRLLVQQRKGILGPISAVLLSLGMLSISFIGSTYFQKGFMGTLPNSLRAVADQRVWSTPPVDSRIIQNVASKLNEDQRKKCIVLKIAPYDSDLNSRWVNSIASHRSTSEVCFAAYWNTTNETNRDIIKKINRLNGEYVLVLTQVEYLANVKFSKGNLEIVSYAPQNLS